MVYSVFVFCFCCFFSSLSSVVSVCVFLLSALVVSVHLVVCSALDMVLCRGWLLGILGLVLTLLFLFDYAIGLAKFCISVFMMSFTFIEFYSN